MEWRGQRIVGPAGATHRISDALYDAFLADFVTDKNGRAIPGLTWIEDDELGAVSAGEASHPDLATHEALGLASSADLTGYALDSDLTAHESAGHTHDHDGTYSIVAHSHTDGGAHPDLASHISLGLETTGHSHAYAATVHTHAQSSVTSLVTDLAGKAASVHTHAQSAITNLTTDLASKADADHTHAGGVGEAFPVGSVFLSVVSTDPATLLGYGTWSRVAQGRFLVGQDGSTYASAGDTGGSASHTHSDHTGTRKGGTSNPASILDGVVSHSSSSNIPPYFVAYFWQRTA